jgi:hypothetical protein
VTELQLAKTRQPHDDKHEPGGHESVAPTLSQFGSQTLPLLVSTWQW